MVVDVERTARRLEAVGMDGPTAQAIADIVADAVEDLATKADLYRMMWILGIGLIAAITALLTLFTGIILALS